MGKASKRLPTKSIGGRLGWRGEGLYKEKATIRNGACNLRRKKKKKKKTLYSSPLSYKYIVLGLLGHHPLLSVG